MESQAGLRIDKWLWHARFAKTRTLAQKLVAGGAVRVNKTPVRAPGALVRPGDVLTVSAARTVRVVRILAIGHRRGPAAEAQTLYEEVVAPAASAPAEPAALARRPDKRGRREARAHKRGSFDMP